MFAFKKLEEKDFNQLFTWLQEPHVKMYWDTEIDYTFEMIYDKYYPRLLDGNTNMFIIKDNDNQVGYIQSYIEKDFLKYNLSEDAVGIDLYIGNINYLNKGYGSQVITDFFENIVFVDKSVKTVVVDPEIDNIIAQKAYSKAGFKHLKNLFSTSENKEQYLMKLVRPIKKL